MYLRCPAEEQISRVVLVKNGVLIMLIYANILYHYFSGSSLLSLPLVLVGLYAVNIFINANEDKFVEVVYELLALKQKQKHKPVHLPLCRNPRW